MRVAVNLISPALGVLSVVCVLLRGVDLSEVYILRCISENS